MISRWVDAWYFWFLLALPVIWVLTRISWKLSKRVVEKHYGPRISDFLLRSVSTKRRRTRWMLRLLALAMMIAALARPQGGESVQEVKSEGIELMLAVDVSESMMSEDVKPNRLEQAKTELSKLVDRMPGNKMGVIAFAGSAALLSPVTTDPAAIKMYLESLSPDSVSSQGTNFESALEMADRAFERGGTPTGDQVKVTRVVLVVSDGEDHEPGALERAKKLTENGYRIFSLAYGTEKGGTIPIRDNMGYMRGFKKDRSGQTIITTVKGDALKALAEAGQGKFYYAAFGADHIANLAKDFENLEQTQFDSKMSTQYEERFYVFIWFALVFFVLELFLRERRTPFRIWRGRFEVPPT